jgi:hypothetical protein
MTVLFATLFILSLITNILLVWYIQKLVNNLKSGVKNIDELQELLEEYSSSLQEMSNLDEYYGDTTINGAVKNTKMVIEACKFYKNSVLEIEEEVAVDKEQNG